MSADNAGATGVDPDQEASEYHRRLDRAMDEVVLLRDGRTLSGSGAQKLVQREQALRYQIRQLRASTAAAAPDILSGLRLAWDAFEAELGEVRRSATRKGKEPAESGRG